MKAVISVVALVLLTAGAVSGRQGKSWKRVHAAQIAYVTDRMELTADESEAFVPIYKEYRKEKRTVRHEFCSENKDLRSAGGEGAAKYIENDLDYQEKVIGIKRKYNEQFLKVVSPKQLKKMYAAEKEFKAMLIRRVKQRRDYHHH